MKRSNRGVGAATAAVTASAAVLLPATGAQGQAVQWVQPAGGAWITGSNWSTGTPPGAGQTARFALNQATPYAVTLGVPQSIGRLDVGRDKVNLTMGPNGSLACTLSPGFRVGVELASGQLSQLTLTGAELSTGSAQVGLVNGSTSWVTCFDGSALDVTGTLTLGTSTSAALMEFHDSTLHVSGNVSHLSASGLSGNIMQFIGPAAGATVGGSWQTTTGYNELLLVDGATVDVGGNLRMVSQTGEGGAIVNGEGSQLSVGSLNLGMPEGGTWFWGRAQAVLGGSIVVDGNVVAGCAPGIGASSAFEVWSGCSGIVGGNVQLGPSASGAAATIGTWVDSTIEVAGNVQARSFGTALSTTITGPVVLAGGAEVFSWSDSSGINMLMPGSVLTAASVAMGPSTAISAYGGTIVAPVSCSGQVWVSVGSAGELYNLSVQGSLVRGTGASTFVLLEKTPTTPLAVMQDVSGPATISGLLKVTIPGAWWSGPRRPVDIIRAASLSGSYATIQLPAAPSGPQLEIVQTPTRVRLQANFPADFNNDGWVDGADLGVMLGAWGRGPSPADLNGDGFVNNADLSLLLASWNGTNAGPLVMGSLPGPG